MKSLNLIVLLSYLLPFAAVAQEGSGDYRIHVGSSIGKEPIDCLMEKGQTIVELVPCAWQRAQLELQKRFPNLEKEFSEVAMPKIQYNKKGMWYDLFI